LLISYIGFDQFQDPAALVIDHTSYAISKIDTDHMLIVSDDVIDSNVILGDKRLEVSLH
jgi:oligosaccharyltransferase complex subunit beta